MTDNHIVQGAVIILVDDDPLWCRMIRLMLEPDDILLLECHSIAEALEMIASNTAVEIDLVLLDRTLPDGDGLSLIPQLREVTGSIDLPVIVQSGRIAEEEVEDGLRFGAFHYLAKPYSRDALRAFVRVAVRNFRDRKRLLARLHSVEDGLDFLVGADFEIRTPADVLVLAPYLARFFPNAETAALGISELLNNAIEHGNLEIGHARKCALLTHGNMRGEVERRLAMPEYRGRRVAVRMGREDDRVTLTIRDDGQGFAWSKYMELDQQRLFDLHGRGIALVRQFCFDGLEYRGTGSEVFCWNLL